MRTKFLIQSTFLMVCGAAFSQTSPKTEKSENKQRTESAVASENILNTVTPVERTALPSELKPVPAVFYIINDQPVDEQTYKNHQKQLLKK